MPLFPQRRHRKASPQPRPSSEASSDIVKSAEIKIKSKISPSVAAATVNQNKSRSPFPSGIGSYFARARRRWITSAHDVSTTDATSSSFNTLLPTTYSSSSSTPMKASTQRHPHQQHAAISPGAVTCNHFLMGGHYYPGKDKKRRHMRRRTWWYRTFCATPTRKVCSYIFVAYVFLWHVALPATLWLGLQILEVGESLSSDNPSAGANFLTKSDRLLPSGGWLLYDKTLLLPSSLEEEQAQRIQIASHRRPKEVEQLRMRLLEKIAPEFFHRNELHEKKKQSRIHQTQLRTQKPQRGLRLDQTPKEPHEKSEAQGRASRMDMVANQASRGKEATKQAGNTAAASVNANRRNMHLGENQKQIENLSVRSVTTDHCPFRTLQNMDLLAANHTSCRGLSRSTNFGKKWSTTLVLQTSVNRLWILTETCHRWKDPIVVAVFISFDRQHVDQDLNVLVEFSSKTKELCPHIELIQYMASEQESEVGHYPVNRLRNVALDRVETSHVLVLDVDFVPSNGLDHTIRSALRTQDMVRTKYPDIPVVSEDLQALVVPAFERLPPQPCSTEQPCDSYLQSNSSFLPKTFDDLRGCHARQDCIVFQSRENWEGHYSTRSGTWLERKWYHHNDDGEKQNLKSVECFHSLRYEPYVVLRWCPSQPDGVEAGDPCQPIAPHYDERFYGYGKNKIELISHLRVLGYQFAVLPDGFVVHNPHPESSTKETWNNRKEYDLHLKMDELYSQFLKELYAMYKPTPEATVQICK